MRDLKTLTTIAVEQDGMIDALSYEEKETLHNRKITKKKLKELLKTATGCTIQHDGWCCGTCFFSISKKFNNKHWQTLLLFRGDYLEETLDNLPKNRAAHLREIIDETIDFINERENSR